MKRFLKWTGIVVGSLVLLFVLVVGLFLGWLRWSGEREWKQAEAELRAKGEKLTFAELVPPMPPDSENFFADPLWAEYADLVLKNNEFGRNDWEPRLPREKRQLEQWQFVPLSPSQKEQLQQLLTSISNRPSRYEALNSLGKQLHQEKDPQKQKEIADLYLGIIAPAQPVLTRIAKLSKRPQAQFPIRYDLGGNNARNTALLVLSQIIHRKALSELLLGKNLEAAGDSLTLLRLASLQNNGEIVSFLIRISSVVMALQAINEGILHHAWSASALCIFQEQLEQINLREGFLLALKVDRAFFNQFTPKMIANQLTYELPFEEKPSNLLKKVLSKVYPAYFGCNYWKNKAYHNLWLQRKAEFLGATIPKGWNAATTAAFDQDLKELTVNPINRWIYALNLLVTSNFSDFIQKAAVCQTAVDQTVIACALERYRLAHGSYPASLDALAPEYLAKLPNSPINGKPMNYSLKPDGTLLLWSPGWNLKSLGGKPGEYRGEGDIVWGEPLANKERTTPTPQ